MQVAGVIRARTLATVLSNDAANVFITLSARSLNPALEIIARGELPSTESKLLQAGANKVVLPTHIGAERITEMILYQETARFIRGSKRMRDFERVLRSLAWSWRWSRRRPAARSWPDYRTGRATGECRVLHCATQSTGGRGDHPPDGTTQIETGDGMVIVGRAPRPVR